MKLHRRKFLRLAAGAAALPALPQRDVGAVLSGASGAHHRSVSSGPGNRHHRAPHRAIAVGAAWARLRDREPDRRGRQHRHRGGRACAPGRLHDCAERPIGRVQRHALPEAQLRSHQGSRSGRRHWRRPLCDGDQSIGPRQHGPGIHRLRQGQSGQAQAWDRPATGPYPMSSANSSK